MYNFKRLLEREIGIQEQNIEVANQRIALAPKGSLSIRKRNKKTDYYQNLDEPKKKTDSKRSRRQINITKQSAIVLLLTDKLIQKHILRRSHKNLFYLKKLQANYLPTDIDSIGKQLGPAYQHVMKEQKKQTQEKQRQVPYPKAPFDEKSHTHETLCGEMVRSKSEQIIMDTLYSYPLIIVHYEEEFIYKVGVPGINRVYPDFTIILPNGDRIIWEHLGKLDDPAYCLRTANKLNLYQQNGYVLGKNLILTMDSNKGDISSSLIIDVIEHYILPKYNHLMLRVPN